MYHGLKTKLHARAEFIQKIRQFFESQGVLEVDTPLLYHTPVTDPYLKAFSSPYRGHNLYLQTSPEYAMKRLLAGGSGPIYQICKAFRDEEFGNLHRPEFTMLEWYRPGFSEQNLINEVDELMQLVLKTSPLEQISYQALFEKYCDFNPHQITLKAAIEALAQHQITLFGLDKPSIDDCLMLLFSNLIEPQIGQDRPIIVFDFPASQSALAKTKCVEGQTVSARFELYFKGIELANAYDEENDASKLRARFEEDLKTRESLGLPQVPIDEKLLAITDQIPNGCGIALGLDRLIMLALGENNLGAIIPIESDFN